MIYEAFPEDIRKTAGFQLHRLQAGLEAADWKPMPEMGRGVEEVRLRYESGAYRIIYIARYANAVYVLHCFNKRRNVLLEHDKHIAKVRYRNRFARRQESEMNNTVDNKVRRNLSGCQYFAEQGFAEAEAKSLKHDAECEVEQLIRLKQQLMQEISGWIDETI